MELLEPVELYDLNGFYMEITSACNLRCLHCYNDSGVLKNQINFVDFEKIVNEFDDPETSITLSGGEPLMHPDFKCFLDCLAAKKFKNSLIVTNATLINEEIAGYIAKSKVPVQVSINGMSSKEHDLLCGVGNFERTMSGLEKLRDAGHNRIVIRCMVSASNVEHIEDFISIMAPKADTILLGFLTESGRGKKNKEIIAIDSFEKHKVLERLKHSKVIEEIEKTGVKVSYPEECFNSGCPLIHKAPEGKVPFNPRIDSGGNVYLCQGFSNVKTRVGNIKKNTLREILASDKLQHYVNFLNLATENIPECDNCVWKATCGRGCIASASERGSVLETDGDCDIRKYVFGHQLINQVNGEGKF